MPTKSIFDAPIPFEPPASAPADPARVDAPFTSTIPPTEPPSPLAAALRDVAGHFERAAIPGPDAVHSAVFGLRALIQTACIATGIPEPQSADAVVSAIFRAMPTVADEADGRVPFESVALGMAAAQHFAALYRFTPAENVERTPQSLAADFVDHALLLADVLDADIRQRTIARRGELFRRDLTIRRALADTGVDAPLQ